VPGINVFVASLPTALHIPILAMLERQVFQFRGKTFYNMWFTDSDLEKPF
jgi:hypothetical protein